MELNGKLECAEVVRRLLWGGADFSPNEIFAKAEPKEDGGPADRHHCLYVPP